MSGRRGEDTKGLNILSRSLMWVPLYVFACQRPPAYVLYEPLSVSWPLLILAYQRRHSVEASRISDLQEYTGHEGSPSPKVHDEEVSAKAQ